MVLGQKIFASKMPVPAMLRAKCYWARRYLPVRCWYRYAEGKMLLGQKVFAGKMLVSVC